MGGTLMGAVSAYPVLTHPMPGAPWSRLASSLQFLLELLVASDYPRA
jgi:hypothetical protein